MSNHTPGPWKWVVEYSEYRDQKYSKVQKDFESSDNCDDGNVRLITEAPIRFTGVVDAWCDRSGDYKGIEIDIADARLIAAAPDLLAACWALFTSFHALAYIEPHMKQAADMGRAAIAKATGEKI